MPNGISIRPVNTKADRKAFVDLPFRLYKDNPKWVPPLKDEAMGLITPKKNPFFEHAEAQLFLAERGGRVVGRISASIDKMWTPMPQAQGGGSDMGNWGYLDAEDKEIADLLLSDLRKDDLRIRVAPPLQGEVARRRRSGC